MSTVSFLSIQNVSTLDNVGDVEPGRLIAGGDGDDENDVAIGVGVVVGVVVGVETMASSF